MPFDLAQYSFGQYSLGEYLIVKRIINNPLLNLRKTSAVLTLILFSCGINLAQASPSHKTIYKSIGKFGETKYSQFEPDTGTKFEVIVMRSDGVRSQPGLLAADSTDRDRGSQSTAHESSNTQYSVATTSSSQSASESDTHSQCQKLRNNLASLNGGGEIYESQANGERRFLNPIEVALKLEDTQKLLTQYCKTN